MSEYTDAILWYASWPILIYLAYKFVLLNLKQLEKIEKNRNSQNS